MKIDLIMKVVGLRNLATDIDNCDDAHPILHGGLGGGEDVYYVAATFMFDDDTTIMNSIDTIKRLFTPASLLSRIIKPAVKGELLTAEEDASAFLFLLPIWHRPPWLKKQWDTRVLHDTQRQAG